MRSAAFWDSSALVPLCVRQSATVAAMALYQKYEAVVWWGSSVEIAAALARLLRMGFLSTADWAESRKLADDLADAWSVIQPTGDLRRSAVEIVQRYDLRAADALQLAAALRWCKKNPDMHVFVTGDSKLRDAALLCGFDAPRI